MATGSTASRGTHVIEENGQRFLVVNGRKLPCRILEPHEMFTDGEEGRRRFQEQMQKVREDFRRREWLSWLAVRDIVLR